MLRRAAVAQEPLSHDDLTPASTAVGPNGGIVTHTPLRWRLAILTATVVAVAVGAVTLVTYWTVSSTLTASVDVELSQKSSLLIDRASEPLQLVHIGTEIERFKSYNPGSRLAVSLPGWTSSRGDNIRLGTDFNPVPGEYFSTFNTVGGERIIAVNNGFGTTVVLAHDMSSTHQLISTLGGILLFIAAMGILLAIAAGMVVATAGLSPLSRLQRAVDYVTRTDDLRPIAVAGTDELAQLTRSFNAMLETLQQSRTQQAQLVADAGHELKTPLTSMRTNIELIMMVNRPGVVNTMSDADLRDMERDVLAQMSELSTLIGDLVDLAREDAPERINEPVLLEETIDSSIERVRRRRLDVDFQTDTLPWVLDGDAFAIGRATLNLLDNAAKWSPPDSTVRVRMTQIADDRIELSVADSGPGINENDRERVFERFYRSPEARAMPGSGLGLAIVKQIIERHGGSIRIEESDDGGTDMRVELPGRPVADDVREPR